MRLSLPTKACALSFALLAGCSAPQNATTVPFSGTHPALTVRTTVQQNAATAPVSTALTGNVTPMQLIELQAAGKLPGPAMPKAMQSMLDRYNSQPQQQPHVTGKGTVAVWATDQIGEYVLGLDESTRNVVQVIDTGKKNAYGPISVKVDHDQNLWVADQYNTANHPIGGVIQEYSKDGTYIAGYKWNPVCGKYSTSCYGYGFDSAENASSVFASVAYVYDGNNNGSDYGSGIFEFINGSPSGKPTYYQVSDSKSRLNCDSNGCDLVYYMDVDTSGNVWFDFSLENTTTGLSTAGGLGELTANGTVSIIKRAGTYVYPGGVYVSNGGSILNVTDQHTRETYQYHLPVTAASEPFHIIGPTRTDIEGLGEPISGGFNSTDTSIVFADSYDWIDRCQLSATECQAIPNLNFVGTGQAGAAYTPSDK